MPAEDPIRIEGCIEDEVRPGIFQVRLPNGHRVIGHPITACRAMAKGWHAGMQVMVELRPFDMISGRLSALPGETGENDS